MSGLPGYDDWKLATPPEYDLPACDGNYCTDENCEDCLAREADEDAYWRHIDAKIDEARGK